MRLLLGLCLLLGVQVSLKLVDLTGDKMMGSKKSAAAEKKGAAAHQVTVPRA
jgi:hypothetical protein